MKDSLSSKLVSIAIVLKLSGLFFLIFEMKGEIKGVIIPWKFYNSKAHNLENYWK